MLTSLFSAGFKVRLALWVAELLLPEKPNLEHSFRFGFFGVALAMLSAMLTAILLASLFAWCGFYLYQETALGLGKVVAITGGTALATAVALACGAYRLLNGALGGLDLKRKKPSVVRQKEDAVDALINGFITGFVAAKPQKNAVAAEPASAPESTSEPAIYPREVTSTATPQPAKKAS